VVKLPFHISE